MNNKQIKTEYERLLAMLDKAQLSEETINGLNPLLENMAWQRVSLNECRKLLVKEGIICEYDNGGGQKGVRENPRFKSYVSLYKIYMSSLEKLLSYIPEEMREVIVEEKKESVLDNVIRLKKAR